MVWNWCLFVVEKEYAGAEYGFVLGLDGLGESRGVVGAGFLVLCGVGTPVVELHFHSLECRAARLYGHGCGIALFLCTDSLCIGLNYGLVEALAAVVELQARGVSLHAGALFRVPKASKIGTDSEKPICLAKLWRICEPKPSF